MTHATTRKVFRTASAARNEIANLLQGLLAAELISPSRCIWLVSPWLSNIAVLDNSAGALQGLDASWARRQIRLVEVLARLVIGGAELHVVVRPEVGNEGVLSELKRVIGKGPQEARLHIHERIDLHAKGLLGDDYCLSGSMNFTRNGVEHLDEMVTLVTDPHQVADLRVAFTQEYGGTA